jgi:hypothetical protein
MAPMRIIPIMIRKPPMVTASLLSFLMRSVNSIMAPSNVFQSLTRRIISPNN